MHTSTARAKTRRNTSSNGRQGRQGKAAQRQQARAEQCYRMMAYLGALPRQEGWAPDVTLEGWRVPSTSDPSTSYIVAHDLARDVYHCDCLAGQHERECVHVLAARRFIWQRRADYARDEAESGGGYNDAYDLAYGVQATSEWED